MVVCEREQMQRKNGTSDFHLQGYDEINVIYMKIKRREIYNKSQ